MNSESNYTYTYTTCAPVTVPQKSWSAVPQPASILLLPRAHAARTRHAPHTRIGSSPSGDLLRGREAGAGGGKPARARSYTPRERWINDRVSCGRVRVHCERPSLPPAQPPSQAGMPMPQFQQPAGRT
eukprot:scaffold9726_cov119-Isochrysis_galbana.AAC.13